MSYSQSHLRKIGPRPIDRRILGHFHMPSHRERNHWKNYPPKMVGASRMCLEYSVGVTLWVTGCAAVGGHGRPFIPSRS